jgi:hypothetical protein
MRRQIGRDPIDRGQASSFEVEQSTVPPNPGGPVWSATDIRKQNPNGWSQS